MLAAAAVKSFDLGGNAPYRIIGRPSGPAAQRMFVPGFSSSAKCRD